MSAQQYACSCTTQAVPLLLLPLHGAPFAELAFGRLAVVRLSCHFICNVTEYRGMLHFIACRTLVYVARGGGGCCAQNPLHTCCCLCIRAAMIAAVSCSSVAVKRVTGLHIRTQRKKKKQKIGEAHMLMLVCLCLWLLCSCEMLGAGAYM